MKHWWSAVALVLACPSLLAGEFVVGQVADMSGPSKVMGQDYVNGAKAYFDAVNKAGGVGGHTIKHVVLDDNGSPLKTWQLTQQLIEQQKAHVLFGYTGTSNVSLVVRRKMLQENNIAMVAPLTGADSLRRPFGTTEKDATKGTYDMTADAIQEGHIPQLFHIRASFGDEARHLVKQATALGLKKVAVLYSDDGFGKYGLAAVEEALKQGKLTLASKGIFNPESLDMNEAIASIDKGNPQAIILIGATNAVSKFVPLYSKGHYGTQYFTLSVVDHRTLVKDLDKQGKATGIGISQVVPMPYYPTTTVAIEHKKAMGSTPLSHASLEGYIAAKVLVEGLKKAGTPDRAKVQSGLSSLGSFDAGGHTVQFTDKERRGSSRVELTVVNSAGSLSQ